jgi:hypothetical protein
MVCLIPRVGSAVAEELVLVVVTTPTGEELDDVLLVLVDVDDVDDGLVDVDDVDDGLVDVDDVDDGLVDVDED